jgi:hypothetical protein
VGNVRERRPKDGPAVLICRNLGRSKVTRPEGDFTGTFDPVLPSPKASKISHYYREWVLVVDQTSGAV